MNKLPFVENHLHVLYSLHILFYIRDEEESRLSISKLI